MQTLIVFEDQGYRNLLPLTYWRTVVELRTGYGTLLDHAVGSLGTRPAAVYCRSEVAAVAGERFAVPVNRVPDVDRGLLLNARLLLTGPVEPSARPAVQWDGEDLLVVAADRALLERLSPETLLDRDAARRALKDLPSHTFVKAPRIIRYPWDLVHANTEMLHLGWEREGCPAECNGHVYSGVHQLNARAIHVGDGSRIKPGVVLDAEHGPIYIDKHVTVSANVSIEGPCYIGPGSLVQPGAVLRDGMSVGRRCKVGGELESSIIHGYSNKQHDGFLGHAYIAEWVNMGADTVNSDLKNTYGPIRVPVNGVEVDSGQMFVGVTIGDHSKTGIGQMFGSGSVMGFAAMVASACFAPKFVPSFTWLTDQGNCNQDADRALAVARRMMARRDVVLTPAEEALFVAIPDHAANIEQPLPDG